MRCQSCGSPMEDEWRFCPRCGYRRRESLFDSIFSRFRREMEEIDKMTKAVDKEFGSFDISDMLQKPGSRGFTIRISSGTGMEPKVEVRTIGDVDRKEVERHLKDMGVRPQVVERRSLAGKRQEPLKMPDRTEEPETSIRKTDGRVIIEMKLPGVEERNIRVQEFESSIEVRAIGREKAFFKIVTKPENASVLRRDFRDNRLVLEVG